MPRTDHKKTVEAVALLVCCAVSAVLTLYWAKFLYNGYLTLLFPGAMDYVEGEVWQQATLIPGPRMYGDLQRYPFFAFEYTPLYHLVVHGLAVLGAPWLIAGRAVSMLSAVALALITAGIVHEISASIPGKPASRWTSVAGVFIAGTIWVAFRPFQIWSYTMRVDMLAVALEFLGIYLGLLSLRRPSLIYASALVFVLVLFTKQSMVAGLLATLMVLLVYTPARALRAAALGTALTLAAFLVLNVITGGGFVRHVIVYNVNRFSLGHAFKVIRDTRFLRFHATYMVVSIITAGVMVSRFLRRSMREIPPGYLLVLLYFCLTSAGIVGMGKSGATDNYLIPLVGSFALLTGLALTNVVEMIPPPPKAWVLLTLSLALLIQILAAPKFGLKRIIDPDFRRQYTELVRMTKQARKPVLSDDMVLLMQAGKEIPWGPFIITELSAQGLFDERKVVAMIKARSLAFAVVTNSRGNASFDERYSPAVATALAEYYPVEHKMAGMRVLEPRVNN